ncbi:MAG TPA: hypothetical protein VJM82_04510 [Nitrospiraceae bacterium]|nr:hypothetical protein [Nitrospiraceae bacterium]
MSGLKHTCNSVKLTVILVWSLVLLFPQGLWAQSNRVEIVGDYRYTYHEPESPVDAKTIAYTEAIRLAIYSSQVFSEGTARVVEDAQVLRDLAQKIASGYLKDLQVVEQSEKGRTVYCKVRAYLAPDEVKTFIEREINRVQVKEPSGLDQNRALQILSVQEAKDGTIAVVFKALKRLDWLATAYDGSLRESADVMIDFYDDQGILVRSDRHPARKTSAGDDVMNPGEIRLHKFVKPVNARSYRVWLVK